jgi:hypothetical protein
MTPKDIPVPRDITSADNLVDGRLSLRPHAGGLFLWSITLGKRTFHRYRDPALSYRKDLTVRMVWCRIDDAARSKTSKPAPSVFLKALGNALSD